MAQVGVKDRRILHALLFFLAFYVLTNPANAGTQARLFIDWVVDQADNVRTFVDATLADEPAAPAPAEPPPAEEPTSP
jgi:hypothetical protein